MTLRPIAAAFLVFGAFWGAWAVAAADVEKALHLSHGGFGLVLSAGLAGAAVTNAIGGAVAEHRGAGRVLGAAMAAWGVLLLLGASLDAPLALGAVILAIVFVGGMIDTVMNVSATAALSPGSLVRFHGLFNGGAALGAGGVGLLLANHRSFQVAWIVVGCATFPVAWACARATVPAGEGGERVPLLGALPVLKQERLLMVAFAFAVSAMVEGGIELWAVLFLRTHLPSGLLVGAVSAVIGYSMATAARVLLGPAAGRRGAATGVTLGATTAAVGLLLIVLGPGSWPKGLGLVLAAGGHSMCWPLLLAHASEGSERPAAVVGGVSAIGYVGFVTGPAVVGTISAAFGLRAGLSALIPAAVFVAAAPLLQTVAARRPPAIQAEASGDSTSDTRRS